MRCLKLNWYILGVEEISSHAHKTGPYYLLGVLFKISDGHPPPPGEGAGVAMLVFSLLRK